MTGLRRREPQRLLHQAGELAVDDQNLGLAVIEHEGERGGVEPGVERVEHAAGHRHAVVAFEHRRRVGDDHGDRVAAPDPARASAEASRRCARRTRRRCAAAGRGRWPGGRETPPPRAPETSAASAAGNWRGCGRDRGRRSSGSCGRPGVWVDHSRGGPRESWQNSARAR